MRKLGAFLLLLGLAACGGGSSPGGSTASTTTTMSTTTSTGTSAKNSSGGTGTEVLTPRKPGYRNIYIQVSGQPQLVQTTVGVMRQKARDDKAIGGFALVPAVHGKKYCSFRKRLPHLGQTITFTIYSSSVLAPAFCYGFGKQFRK